MSKKKKIVLTVLIVLLLLVVFSIIIDVKQIILSSETVVLYKQVLENSSLTMSEIELRLNMTKKAYFIRYAIICSIDFIFLITGIFAIIKTIKNKEGESTIRPFSMI